MIQTVNPASRMTLGRHIVECQRHHPRARGELSVLLIQMALAGKVFSHALRSAALTGSLGLTGDRNVQGEATKKLDAFGNHTIVEAFATSELVAAIVSEEMDEPRQVACGRHASYVLESIHQRVPLGIGSEQEVALFARFAGGFGPATGEPR